ncbi:MAG: hypothetical protein A2506_01670 [Elusimicrobia bacterium RIFOXYD12_FULL_66_9]|nr:MAG: hypothetical protein A2506_01670 [Elusimicrobia bacterium RIFOXYD12_FULL_66_9]
MNLPLTLLTAALAFPLAASAADLTGTVVETMDAGGYTYLRLKTPAGDKWAAVSQTKTKLKKGSKATVVNSMDMKNFESPTLKRKFDVIAFGMLGNGSAPASGAMGGMPANMSHGSKAPAKDFGPIKVAKAAGADARTVAEVYAKKKALKGKDVVVSGKVVKYNAGIMDRNWAHLRDGSGSDKGGDNDLTVVMKDEAELGQVITVRGKVFLDKDLGGMYKFPVSLDEATLVK